MPSPPPTTDDGLLARLNALKKSPVSLDTTPSASIPATDTSTPADALAARFARLGSASPASSPKPSRTAPPTDPSGQSGDNTAPAIAPGAASYLEAVAEGIGCRGVEFNEEDEKSLEQLLGELGERGAWDVSTTEQEDVGKLLGDIKRILPDVQKSMGKREEDRPFEPGHTGDASQKQQREGLTHWENIQVDIGSAGVKVGRDEVGEAEQDHDEEEKKKTENEEADDVIARVMAELDISKKYDDVSPSSPVSDARDQTAPPKPSQSEKESPAKEDDTDSFTLPAAPTTLPDTLPADDLAKTQALEDALTARLAALSKPNSSTDALGLPSAPSFAPAQKPPKIVQSGLPTYTDEEIESWCVICNDDATLKCLGCDGDLYCQQCWMEGHRGAGAGYEERRHKAVLYVKKKPEAAVAAA